MYAAVCCSCFSKQMSLQWPFFS